MTARFGFSIIAVAVLLVVTLAMCQGMVGVAVCGDSVTGVRDGVIHRAADDRTVIDFISINGNAHFHQVAAQYDWPGTGMEWDPYIIEGYYFNSTYHLFTVTATTVYWEFRDNILDGIDDRWCQIVISNLRNAKISDNIFMRGSVGIHCIGVNDSMFVGNTMYEQSFDGVFLEYSHRNIIASNTFHDEGEGGVLAWTDSSQNTIRNNQVYNSPYGFLLWHQAHDNIVRSNTVHHTTLMGMDIQTDDNIITGNQIHHVEGDAICIAGDRNVVSGNTVYNNTGYGINAASIARSNTIENNVFINCEEGGVQLHEAEGCTVSENDFLGNGINQAIDYGDDNVFDHNYWHEWIGNDTNDDGFIDSPKLIYGGTNADLRPALEPIHSIPEWYAFEPITGPPEEPVVTTTSTTTITSTTTTTGSTTSSTTSSVDGQLDSALGLGVLGVSGALIVIAVLIVMKQVKQP